MVALFAFEPVAWDAWDQLCAQGRHAIHGTRMAWATTSAVVRLRELGVTAMGDGYQVPQASDARAACANYDAYRAWQAGS